MMNSAVVDRVQRGFAWWIAELEGMLPPPLRQMVAGTGPSLVVDLDGDVVTVRTMQSGELREIGRLEMNGLAAEKRRVRLATLLPLSEAKSSRAAVVRLPPARVLVKKVDLPAAAAENLREVLAFDIDRQTPFRADQVYFDYQVREIDRKAGRLFVDLVVAPRSLVDAGAGVVRDLGLVPRKVTVAWPEGRGPAVNLLPRSDEPSGPRLVRPLTLALGALAFGLAVAAIAVPLRQRYAIAEALDEQVADQRKRAEAVRRVESEIEKVTKQSRFIVDRRAGLPLTVELLDELTRVVPDDTWLFRVRSNGREVQIFGYSTAATALIGLIEQSSQFVDAQFRAPLTRDARTDAERLHIGFRLDERPES